MKNRICLIKFVVNMWAESDIQWRKSIWRFISKFSKYFESFQISLRLSSGYKRTPNYSLEFILLDLLQSVSPFDIFGVCSLPLQEWLCKGGKVFVMRRESGSSCYALLCPCQENKKPTFPNQQTQLGHKLVQAVWLGIVVEDFLLTWESCSSCKARQEYWTKCLLCDSFHFGIVVVVVVCCDREQIVGGTTAAGGRPLSSSDCLPATILSRPPSPPPAEWSKNL